MAWLTEWSDNKQLQNVNLVLALIALGVSFFLFVNIKGLENVALIFLIMAIVSTIAIASDGISSGGKFLEFISFGKSVQTALLGLLIGIGAGLLIYSAKTFSILKIATPVLTTSAVSSLPVIDLFGFIIPTSFVIIVLLAPLCEELFFRQTVFPTIARIGGNTMQARIISIVLTSAVFAMMHYFAYGAQPALLISAFIFSSIAIVGNFVIRSILFGVGIHSANNLVTYMNGSTALLWIVFAIVAGFYLASIAFNLKKIRVGE